MITKIQKWGNSLGLRIPKGVARGARVREGTTVMLAVSNGRLVVAPLETRGYELETLLAGVRRNNLHTAVDTGGPVGRETWQMARAYTPDRGDLVWLEFNPQAGHEQAGHRPALAISPGAYNRRVGLALFCPVTSQVKGYPFEVALPAGLPVGGVVLSDQVKSLDWRARKVKRIAKASPAVIDEVLGKLATLVR